MRFGTVTFQDSTSRMEALSRSHCAMSDAMDVSTSPFDDEHASDRVRERMLLHWVNSLPLTKCLLVEELRDLRFGDVLHEIVRWLQTSTADNRIDADQISSAATDDDSFGNDAIRERVRGVVQLVASECRSQDEDAMYVVNGVDCVDRVMEGQSNAICAVLKILRRLSVQHLCSIQATENERGALQQRRAQEEMIERSLLQPRAADEPLKVVEFRQKSKKHCTSLLTSTRVPRNVVKPSALTRRRADQSSQSNVQKRTSTRREISGAKKKISKTDSRPETRIKPNSEALSVQMDTFHDDSGLRVFGMLDPTAKPPLGVACPRSREVNGRASESVLANRFCSWAQRILQIKLPLGQIFADHDGNRILHSSQNVRQVFASGELLGRIAAAVVKRYGNQLKQNIPTLEQLESNDLETVTAKSDTPAERYRSLGLALAVFKGCGISKEALASIESLQSPGNQFVSIRIWRALDEVLYRVEQIAHTNPRVSTVINNERLQVDTNCLKGTNNDSQHICADSPMQIESPPSRQHSPILAQDIVADCGLFKRNRPYITNEQMRVVNEWLTRAGFNEKRAPGSGVLQDPMRNGVLLCKLLPRVSITKSLSYFKVPRTLLEMRDNISKAFKWLSNLPNGQIPQCYLTPAAEQAVLIGDRQVNYGLLWHLWQLCQEQSTVGLFNDAEDREATKSPKPTQSSLPTKFMGVRTLSSEETGLSPLSLDIPAVALAGQGKSPVKDDQGRFVQVRLDDSFARRLAWGESHANGDDDADDDVIPVPKAPSSSPIYSEELVPTARNDVIIADQMHEFEPQTRITRDDLYIRENEIESPAILASDQEIATIASDAVITSTVQRAEPIKTVKQCNDENDLATISPTVHKEHTQALARESVADILAWLTRLDIHIQNAAAFHDPSAKLVEFQSGVLLCCIVEKVELMRSISGITRPSGKQQLSKASALHNISKALAMLKQKKTMPLHLLRRSTAIYAGDREVILQLLLQIRKAYGHHHAPRPRIGHSPAA